ncbi:putative anti-sigma F factor [Gottschalkia purinilytica]|uniref:Putative anti-sigma F factor n=1 Tax=Gottschalkia purinilytica TaxID=1503 RepID=A0A0L0W8U4_GOTPU|nr:ATP-binding protein [Gottschalkia purinilytica]KNF07882.1 putative anti-sigma F factor [Gottschalkia purinilytica]
MIFETNVEIKSDLMEVRKTLNDIIDQISNILNDELLIFDIKLILNELVINSVVHGNKLDADKKVNLKLKVSNDCIKIEVLDEGTGFSYDKEQYDPMDLKCSGRGLVLVDGLTDKLSINNNKVSIVKYI